MAEVFAQSECLQDLNDTMAEMIAACNVSAVLRLINSHCPLHVVTRWFSRDISISWLLQRQQILSNLDLSLINVTDWRRVARVINAENFAELTMLKNMVSPLTKCMQFFERADTSISFVLPVPANLQRFLDTTLRS
jgi:hypothetical protein